MNAIILAAGMGNRLSPITESCPKPLIKINSQPIIERQIVLLKESGINDIHIVVGHLKESYLYLIKKFGVHLIYNNRFRDINNIYSVYLARELLSDSLIIEGDLYLTRNIFDTCFEKSFYFTGKKSNFIEEWILEFNADNMLTDMIKPKELKSVEIYKKGGAFVLTGISYWGDSDSRKIRYYLEEVISAVLEEPDSVYKSFYWDEIVMRNLDSLDVYVKKINRDDWFEIDSLRDIHTLNRFLKKVSA